MKKTPKVFLLHIITSIEKIERFILGKSLEYFMKDELLQDGVIREIEVIGEAIKHLDEEFRAQNPEVPWSEIVATRNILIHEYWDVDLKRVWYSAIEEVPKLKEQVKHVLELVG